MTEELITQYREANLRILDVYSIFQNHFGEEFVDIQNYPQTPSEIENPDHATGIVVYFPEVRVTNEYGSHVDIKDLYAYIKVKNNGSFSGTGFQLVRTTFPRSQFNVGYTHSHVSVAGMGHWSSCCTGEGPINDTMRFLMRGFNEFNWMLFCRELDEYTKVESLEGGPYIRMSAIESQGNQMYFSKLNEHIQFVPSFIETSSLLFIEKIKGESDRTAIVDFLKYLFNTGELRYNWDAITGLVPAFSPVEFTLLMSKHVVLFATRYNKTVEDLKNLSLMIPAVFKNGALFYPAPYQSEDNEAEYEGRFILTFKGEPKYFHILDDTKGACTQLHILNYADVKAIYRAITVIINHAYGKSFNFNGRTAIV